MSVKRAIHRPGVETCDWICAHTVGAVTWVAMQLAVLIRIQQNFGWVIAVRSDNQRNPTPRWSQCKQPFLPLSYLTEMCVSYGCSSVPKRRRFWTTDGLPPHYFAWNEVSDGALCVLEDKRTCLVNWFLCLKSSKIRWSLVAVIELKTVFEPVLYKLQ
jgi:hypothetical protein